MIKNNNRYLLIETTAVSTPSDIELLQESKTPDGKLKAIFRTRVQTCDERNLNGRIYSRSVCESIVNQLQPKAKKRALLLEVDHPLLQTSDPNVIKKRAATCEYKSSGGLIRDIKMIGNDIIAEIETISGFYGPDMAAIVLYDKIDIGFSLRALGEVETLPNGTIMVKEPIKAITYDFVQNPSHASAKILEYLPENTLDLVPSSNIICESEDLSFITQDKINIINECINEDYIKNIIDNKFKKISSKLQFKI